MANKNEDPQPLTAQQVLELIERQNKTFLEGIERMRVPYVDPIKAADRKKQLEDDRRRYEVDLARQKREQESCSHLRFDKTSTFWPFEYEDKVIRLICCRCQLMVGPEHKDYRQLIYNTASTVDIQ